MNTLLVTPLLVVAVLAWRMLVTLKNAHEASRRWSIRPALPWSLLLLSVDVIPIAAVLLMPVSLTGLISTTAGTLDGRVVDVIVAVALAAAVRHLPFRRGRRPMSLRRYVMSRIEQAAYDRADDWIYREVYPRVPAPRMKPFVNAIRRYLESRPGPQGSLDASYVAKLILPGRTPSQEDLRAACHRMLARGERKRLMDLVAGHADQLSGDIDWVPDPDPGSSWLLEADDRWSEPPIGGTSVGVAIYVEAADSDSEKRVRQAAEAVARAVGDADRG